MHPTDISVIVVSYNTKNLTRACLQSIIEKTNNVSYQITVVDNASADGSQAMVREEFPHVQLIESETNLGFGRANNIAIRQSTSKYVFLLNSDTVLVNNALEIFFDFMESRNASGIWCCGGNLYHEDMTPQASFGHFPSFMQILFEFGLYKISPEFYRRHYSIASTNDNPSPFRVDYISGADMFIRKDILDRFGPFDEDFFLYYEETELSCRMKRHGFDSIMLPDAKIIHLGGQSTAIASIGKMRLMEKSKYMFFRKCYGVVPVWFAKALYTLKYFLHFVKTGNAIFLRYVGITLKS